jgi:hypothetical protein
LKNVLNFKSCTKNNVRINYNFRISLPFEEAYCLYRLNKTTEALEVLIAIEEPSAKEKELLAQVVIFVEVFDKVLPQFHNSLWSGLLYSFA